ncbi:MAG TPA: trehalose-6-phosphate synthase [Aquabacterium sp.]|uniref:alpha,alpha-trehalose-phosphate synthase (UDP-forming) n=1 Tax=Aquabacterium sp. TaxID=1872578 RepID=UPI002E34B864|nr:trehalose-6-phosphate synthase [Aquabacterium sp.]HEX5357935.1 trehalose-6-phosphate synthase [Aquabacterium sp.]
MPFKFIAAIKPGIWRIIRLCAVFIVPLIGVIALLSSLVQHMVTPLLLNWADRDLDERANLIAKVLQEPAATALRLGDTHTLTQQLERVTQDERLLSAAVCDQSQHLFAWSQRYPVSQGCNAASGQGENASDSPANNLHVNLIDVPLSTVDNARMVLVHDRNYAWRRGELTQRYIVWVFSALGTCLAAVLLLTAHWSWRSWVKGVRRILLSDGTTEGTAQASPEIAPLIPDLRRLLRSVNEDRRILKDTTIEWRPETLKLLLREHMFGDEVMVVSNREPYIHELQPDGRIEVIRPASGLVTAVEPVMRACSGTWIAHGSGSADDRVVDARSRIQVPPEGIGDGSSMQGTYTLRRVWLSQEEEQGYYQGFANEGLWPLCHIAHVRPVFRDEDWKQYLAVNTRFADAVVAEARSDNPVVLVQDYHFALLPKLLRERLPRATILTFWHIPWPNVESFGICPWSKQILEGLLGSSIIGFHTRYHCQNFMESVDRFMESRISREDATVTYQAHRTKVRDYPISIHWPPPAPNAAELNDVARKAMRLQHGLPMAHKLGIGVDRLDYTKGIVERMLAVESMLEQQPQWRGRFTFIQVAAPTRSTLDAYQRLEASVRQQAQRINDKFEQLLPGSPPAIILLIEHHDAASVLTYYRSADLAMVTSLHDGMNLVAKEFIAARDADDGVLILSRFAGAAGELREALIVNPYHIGQTAAALTRALDMSLAEQQERMRALRKRLSDFNIYRWAGRMLLDAADERQHIRVQDRIVQVASASTPRRLHMPWQRRA